MKDIKEIIAPVDLIVEDVALENHLYECILTGDFATLKTEQKALIDATTRFRTKYRILDETYQRMKLANGIMYITEGKNYIYLKSDFRYIEEQIDKAKRNCWYYQNRLDLINRLLEK